MLFNIYRLGLCVLIVSFLMESLWWLFANDPISPAWATFGMILCSYMLWERIVLSIRIQNFIDFSKDN